MPDLIQPLDLSRRVSPSINPLQQRLVRNLQHAARPFNLSLHPQRSNHMNAQHRVRWQTYQRCISIINEAFKDATLSRVD